MLKSQAPILDIRAIELSDDAFRGFLLIKHIIDEWINTLVTDLRNLGIDLVTSTCFELFNFIVKAYHSDFNRLD